MQLWRTKTFWNTVSSFIKWKNIDTYITSWLWEWNKTVYINCSNTMDKRQLCIVVKTEESRDGLLRFKMWLHYLLAVWLRDTYLTSQCLNLPSAKCQCCDAVMINYTLRILPGTLDTLLKYQLPLLCTWYWCLCWVTIITAARVKGEDIRNSAMVWIWFLCRPTPRLMLKFDS